MVSQIPQHAMNTPEQRNYFSKTCWNLLICNIGICQSRQIMGSGVQDQPSQYGETLSLLKIQKLTGVVVGICNPSYVGGWRRRITSTWEAEVAVIQDHATALQPGQQSQTLSPKQKTTKDLIPGTRQNDNNIINIKSPIWHNYRVLDFDLLQDYLVQYSKPLQMVTCSSVTTFLDEMLCSPIAAHSVMQ